MTQYRLLRAFKPQTFNKIASDKLLSDDFIALNQELKADALRSVAKYGILGLVVGAGLSSLTGLTKLLNPPDIKDTDLATSYISLEPKAEPDDKSKKNKKQKSNTDITKSARDRDLADYIVENFIPTKKVQPDLPGVISPSWYRGDTQTELTGLPWYIPAVFFSPILGYYIGSGAIKKLFKQQLKQEIEEDLDEAKQEYEAALKELSEKGSEKKAAFDLLDDIYDDIINETKSRLIENGFYKAALDLNTISGQAMGLYLVAASLLAGLGAYSAYNLAKDSSPDSYISKIIRARAAWRSMHNPPEVRVRISSEDEADDSKIESDKSKKNDDKEKDKKKSNSFLDSLF